MNLCALCRKEVPGEMFVLCNDHLEVWFSSSEAARNFQGSMDIARAALADFVRRYLAEKANGTT